MLSLHSLCVVETLMTALFKYYQTHFYVPLSGLKKLYCSFPKTLTKTDYNPMHMNIEDTLMGISISAGFEKVII